MALAFHDYIGLIAAKIEFVRTLLIADTDVQLEFRGDADALSTKETTNCLLENSTSLSVGFIGHYSKSARRNADHLEMCSGDDGSQSGLHQAPATRRSRVRGRWKRAAAK